MRNLRPGHNRQKPIFNGRLDLLVLLRLLLLGCISLFGLMAYLRESPVDGVTPSTKKLLEQLGIAVIERVLGFDLRPVQSTPKRTSLETLRVKRLICPLTTIGPRPVLPDSSEQGPEWPFQLPTPDTIFFFEERYD